MLGWLSAAGTQGGPLFAWRDPEAEVEVVGLGIAHETHQEWAQGWGGHSCSRIYGQCSATVGPPIPKHVPAVWIGKSFSGDDPQGCWSGWPRACVRVPRVLAYCTPQGTGWVAQALSYGDDDAAVTALQSELRTVERRFKTLPEHRSEGAETAREPLETDEAWRDLVRRARAAVRAGELAKVVVARGVRHRCPKGFDPVATLAALWREHPNAFGFALGLGTQGCFLGATPELLVRVQGLRVHGQALAGTTTRGLSPEGDRQLGEALLACPKNRLEHSLVVQAIDQALRPRCRDLTASEQPLLKRLPGLQHLETRFRGTLQTQGSVSELAAALHPTPAVGGWPRRGALDWLRTHEGLARGWYAAPIGVLNADGDGVFVVAIRSALLRGEEAWAFAGAGIVADSDPQLELDETELKLGAVEQALKAGSR